jgi:hypothetical protein
VGGRPGRLLRLVDAQQRLDRGQHLARLGRLEQVAVGALLQAVGFVLAADEDARQVQHRDARGRRVRLDAPAHLETAHVRQVDVEDDEVGLVVDQPQRLAARGGLRDGVPGRPQQPAEAAPVGRIVVHIQDAGQSFRGHALFLRSRKRGRGRASAFRRRPGCRESRHETGSGRAAVTVSASELGVVVPVRRVSPAAGEGAPGRDAGRAAQRKRAEPSRTAGSTPTPTAPFRDGPDHDCPQRVPRPAIRPGRPSTTTGMDSIGHKSRLHKEPACRDRELDRNLPKSLPGRAPAATESVAPLYRDGRHGRPVALPATWQGTCLVQGKEEHTCSSSAARLANAL